jgi:transporter family-2 protein
VDDRAGAARSVASGIGVAIAVAAGIVWAIQAKMNAQFGAELDDPLVSASLNFICGSVVLLVAAAARPRSTGAAITRLRGAIGAKAISPLALLAGFVGVGIVLAQVYVVDLIGIAAFTVTLVAGSAIAAIVIDATGLGPDGVVRITRLRILGAVVLIVAVALVAFGQGGFAGLTAAAILGLAVALLTGVLVALQTAMTGALVQASGAIVVPMLIAFVVGAVLLPIVRAFFGPVVIPADVSWIFLIAGPLAVVFVSAAAVLAGRMSLLLLSAGIVIGQTVGAIAIDLIFPTLAGRPGWIAAVGVALAIGAVVIIAFATRRQTASR